MKKAQLVPVAILAALLFLWSCSEEEGVVPSPNPNPGPDPAGSFSIKVIEDDFEGVPIVLAGSRGRNFAVAFERELNGELRRFIPLQGQLPLLMEDEQGNRYDAFGQVAAGPEKDAQLRYVNSGMGYWFVFGAMYPGLEIFGQGSRMAEVNLEPAPGWSIPTSVVAQGSGFESIQALESPDFITFSSLPTEPGESFFLEEEDLVIVVSLNGETKVYPHAILDWHEVVNDVVGGIPVAVTYCPLTGTGKVWKREAASPEFSFGISGLLYNNNVLPFDRPTESFWNQLEATSVFGDRLGEQLTLVPFLETTWGSWKRFEDSPKLLSPDTGIDRDYTEYPYGNYKTSDIVTYPLAFNDDRLPRKERVFSVLINGKAKVYRLEAF